MGIVLLLIALCVAVVAFHITQWLLRKKSWASWQKWLAAWASAVAFGAAGFGIAILAFRTPSGHF